jgi:carboxymethylenebutenolidase
MGETIDLVCEDGVTISAWRARPNGKPRGGMVVLQEIFGVNHHIRTVADRYAAEGYLAIAPALFNRVEAGVELGYDGVDRPRAMDMRGRTKIEDTMLDIAAAIAVAAEGGKVGVVGYCWGGTLAWAAAAHLSGLAAAVGYYGGGIAAQLSTAPRVPVMLHFGAKDKSIPLTAVEAIRTAFPAVPVYVYDADHGFNCDERSAYDPPSAATARVRTLEFFERAIA